MKISKITTESEVDFWHNHLRYKNTDYFVPCWSQVGIFGVEQNRKTFTGKAWKWRQNQFWGKQLESQESD